jgi:hypothetical protein
MKWFSHSLWECLFHYTTIYVWHVLLPAVHLMYPTFRPCAILPSSGSSLLVLESNGCRRTWPPKLFSVLSCTVTARPPVILRLFVSRDHKLCEKSSSHSALELLNLKILTDTKATNATTTVRRITGCLLSSSFHVVQFLLELNMALRRCAQNFVWYACSRSSICISVLSVILLSFLFLILSHVFSLSWDGNWYRSLLPATNFLLSSVVPQQYAEAYF